MNYFCYCLCFCKVDFGNQHDVLSVDDFADKSFSGICSGLAFSQDPKATIVDQIKSYVDSFSKMAIMPQVSSYDMARLGDTIYKLLNSVCVFVVPVDKGFLVESFSSLLSEFVNLSSSELDSIYRAHELFLSLQKKYSDFVALNDVKEESK